MLWLQANLASTYFAMPFVDQLVFLMEKMIHKSHNNESQLRQPKITQAKSLFCVIKQFSGLFCLIYFIFSTNSALGQVTISGGGNSYIYYDKPPLSARRISGISEINDINNNKNKVLWVAADGNEKNLQINTDSNIDFVGDLCIGTSSAISNTISSLLYQKPCIGQNNQKTYQGALILKKSNPAVKSIVKFNQNTVINPGSSLILQNDIEAIFNGPIFLNGTKGNRAMIIIGSSAKNDPAVSPGAIATAYDIGGASGSSAEIVLNHNADIDAPYDLGLNIGSSIAISLSAYRGTTKLSGINTYDGDTFIGTGATIKIDSVESLSSNSALTIDGTLQLNVNKNKKIKSLDGGGTLILANGNNNNYIDIYGSASEDGWHGYIAGNPTEEIGKYFVSQISIGINGDFVWGGSSTYYGDTYIEAGTTKIKSSTAIAKSTNGVYITSYATLDVSAVKDGSVILSNLEGSKNSNLNIGQAEVILNGAQDVGEDNIFNGNITGDGTVTIAGLYNFGGSNSYKGITIIKEKSTGIYYHNDQKVLAGSDLKPKLTLDTSESLPINSRLQIDGILAMNGATVNVSELKGSGIIDFSNQGVLNVNGGGRFAGNIKSDNMPAIINLMPSIGETFIFDGYFDNQPANQMHSLNIGGQGVVSLQSANFLDVEVNIVEKGSAVVQGPEEESILFEKLSIASNGKYIINITKQKYQAPKVKNINFASGSKLKVVYSDKKPATDITAPIIVLYSNNKVDNLDQINIIDNLIGIKAKISAIVQSSEDSVGGIDFSNALVLEFTKDASDMQDVNNPKSHTNIAEIMDIKPNNKYEITINNGLANTAKIITYAAIADGAILQISNQGQKIPDSRVLIIEALDSVDINLDKVQVIDNMPSVNSKLLLDSSSLSLKNNLLFVSFELDADYIEQVKNLLSPNSVQLLSLIDQSGLGNPVAHAVFNTPSPQKAADVVEQLSRHLYAQSFKQMQSNKMDIISSVSSYIKMQKPNNIDVTMAYTSPASRVPKEEHGSIWIGAVGGWGNNNGIERIYHTTIGGVIGGELWLRDNKAAVGLFGGYNKTYLNGTGFHFGNQIIEDTKHSVIESMHLGLYNKIDLQYFILNILTNFAWNNIKMVNHIIINEQNKHIYNSAYDSLSSTIMGEFLFKIYSQPHSQLFFFLKGLGQYVLSSGFQEVGGADFLAATVQDFESHALLSTIGFRNEVWLPQAAHNAIMYSEIGWQHDYSDGTSGFPMALNNGSMSFVTRNDVLGEMIVMGFGLKIPLSPGRAVVDIGYFGRFSKYTSDNMVNIEVSGKI